MKLFDKRGIPIERGDVVKVFHFIGARRKRHYMYKQCLGIEMFGREKDFPLMKFSHLNFAAAGDRDEYYTMRPEDAALEHYEIVQSVKCDHERRERLKPTLLACQPPVSPLIPV